MKLLMITGDRALAEGKRGAFYNTIEEFHKHWERIDIICPKVNSGKSKVESLFQNVFIHPSPWPLVLQPLWILREGFRILKSNDYKLEAKDYVMTVHEYPPFYNGMGARLLWQRTKIPYVMEILHIPGYPKPADSKESLYKNLMRWFIKLDSSRSRAIRVMNKDQVPGFLIKSGVPENKIKYIPAIYVDSEVFKPMDFQKEYDLIFIGRLESNKGIELFIETAKKLNCKALIVGDGSLRKNLELQVVSHRLNVKLHGWAKDHNEIAELINKSKLLIMTSYNEGGPRVVVEAMACGVPALATPVGIVPDLLKNSLGGEIIQWNADDIADKASKLLNDPETYRKQSLNGVEAAKQFEKKSAIRNYATEIQKLI